MKKEKRNKGITLIALIVTIIVLLILAAVALNTLMGENGILSKASGAKDKTNYAQAKEDIDLAITETQARVIADENRNANLKDVVETLKNNSTYEYDVFLQSQKIASLGSKTNFADFTESTTTIYVIHHAYNDVEIKVEMDASGKISTSIVDGSGSSDSNEEDEVQYVETSADEISKDPQQNYGKEVCYGVDLDGDETTNDWIIFYSEGQNIFITPKKYLPSSFISGNKTLLKDDDDKYNVIWNSSKQTGLQSIKEETRTLFKSTGYILNSNYKSSRFSSMLLNTDNWQNLVDTDSGAIYAIGSPTIEMWAASWNKLNSSSKVYLSNSTTSHETGYFMSNVAGDITKNNGNTIVMVNNEVFFPALDDEDSSENYFLSSPISSTWFSTMPDGGTSTSIGGDGNIMFDVKHDSSTKYLTHRDVSMSGKLRPIVCISGKDGDSAKVQVKAVCKINETGEKYSSIEAAIAECKKETAQTITLFEDIKKDTITIGADNKVNLILNGKNITSTIEYNGIKQNINYIRNSVKVLIDAYDGTVSYYITDRTDPIAMAYRNLYPTLFENIDEKIPEDISKNFIYPQYLYNIQSKMITLYHNVKPDVLYRSDDIWEQAKYNTTMQTTKATGTVLSPYYTMLKTTDSDKDTLGLVQTFTPSGKQNIISYLVGSYEDGTSKLKLYKYASDNNILGPMQLDTQISQDETISKELDALNVTGTKITKQMIIVPIQNTLLYIEPIYQTMINESDVPVLKKIIVASGNKVAIGNNINEAIKNLLSQYAVDIEIENTDDLQGLIDAIIKANNNLTESNKNNDWEMMGSDIKKLQGLVNSLEKLQEEEKKKNSNTTNSTDANEINSVIDENISVDTNTSR